LGRPAVGVQGRAELTLTDPTPPPEAPIVSVPEPTFQVSAQFSIPGEIIGAVDASALVHGEIAEQASSQDQIDTTVNRGGGFLAPASDRVVISTHNSQIDAAMHFLELGMRAIESWNSFDDDVERERMSAELSAIKKLLEASTVRIDLLRFHMTTSLGSFVVAHPEAPMLNQVIEAVRGINGRLDELVSAAT
jgi:hypothetical protein